MSSSFAGIINNGIKFINKTIVPWQGAHLQHISFIFQATKISNNTSLELQMRTEFIVSNVDTEFGFICNLHSIAKIVGFLFILCVLITSCEDVLQRK